jgi:hypothetical protein
VKPKAVEYARRGLALLRDPRQLRSRLLSALSQAVDGYMRSPVFLVCMRYGLAATIEAQSLQAAGFVRRASGRPRERSSER